MLELVGLENKQHIGARVRPDRRVAEGIDLDLKIRLKPGAHPFSHRACACWIVVDVGVIAQVIDGFLQFSRS